MGRLAGQTFAQSVTKSWKDRVEEARAEKLRSGSRPAGPKLMTVPSAARRQLALLWWLTELGGDRRAIGRRNAPPLTADMRILIARGLARLERTLSEPGSLSYKPTHRTNELVITPAGRAVLNRGMLKATEIAYARHAPDLR